MKTYKFKINGKEYKAEIKNDEGKTVELEINGKTYSVELEKQEVKKPTFNRPAATPAASESVVEDAPKKSSSNAGAGAIKSPLPGTILDVFVNVGDSVKSGQKLVLLEAMKMENQIDSDRNGVVKEVHVRKSDVIMEDDVLVVIE